MPKRKLIPLVLALFIGVLMGVWILSATTPPNRGDDIGGSFELVDQTGDVRSETLFKGHWSALFFGFTHCPDICPTTLVTLADVQRTLEDQVELSVVFVSVDPERDSPEVLKDYLASDGLPVGTIGLTGSPEAIDHMTKIWRVYAQKAGDGEDYNVDHSSVVYLVAPDGKVSAVGSASESAQTMADKFRRAIETNARL